MDGRSLVEKYRVAHDAHDAETMSMMCSPECALVGPVDVIRGRDAIRELLDRFLSAFSNDRFIVTRLLVSGRTLILEWSFEAQHSAVYHGPLGDVLPLGRRLKVEGVDLFDVGHDDLIVRYRSYFDHLDLLRQLGEPADQAAT